VVSSSASDFASIGAAVAGVAAVLLFRFQTDRQNRHQKMSIEISRDADHLSEWNQLLEGVLDDRERLASGDAVLGVEQWLKRNADKAAANKELTPEAAKIIEELRTRVEAFEQRFPEADEIDKYASVNEALMQQKIEFLTKQVDNLRDELAEQRKSNLSTGKVYGIVFTVLAGLFAVVAAVPFVVDQFKN